MEDPMKKRFRMERTYHSGRVTVVIASDEEALERWWDRHPGQPVLLTAYSRPAVQRTRPRWRRKNWG
jgi:hypothetical protein